MGNRLGIGRAALSLVLLAAGCGPTVSVPQEGESSTSHGTPEPVTTSAPPDATDAAPTTTGLVTTTEVTTSPADSGDDDSADDGNVFLLPVDVGDEYECDLWANNCPTGQKCMPWANDGGGSWNATRCSPLAEDPNEVGEPCTVEGSAVSGIDDCVVHSMCWDVDQETNVGECVGFCQGSEANPSCANPCEQCTLTSSGVLILCFPTCDPIAQDCPETQACYPLGDSFACAPDAGGEEGLIGDACEFLNVCDPGNYCADAARFPGCDGSGCCTPFCNLEAPDDCDARVPGTTCEPWFEGGGGLDSCLPEGTTVGACLLPP